MDWARILNIVANRIETEHKIWAIGSCKLSDAEVGPSVCSVGAQRHHLVI